MIGPKLIREPSHSDSDTETSVDNTPVKEPRSYSFIASWVLGGVGLILGMCGFLHQVGYINEQMALGFFAGGASLLFIASVIAACNKHYATASICLIAAGILFCTGSDIAETQNILSKKISSDIDYGAISLIGVGIIFAIAAYYVRRREELQKLEVSSAKIVKYAQITAAYGSQPHAASRPRTTAQRINPNDLLFHAIAQNDSLTLAKTRTPNAKNVMGTTLLQVAIMNKTADCALALLNKEATIIEGVDISIPIQKFSTTTEPVQRGKWETVIKIMLFRGAQVSPQDFKTLIKAGPNEEITALLAGRRSTKIILRPKS